MNKFLLKSLASCALAAVAAGASAQANHLLFSEIGLYPADQTEDNSAEYVEIYNPTSQPVSLENYYLTDTNNYANLPISPDGKVSGATTDHLLRFPAGTVLQPGQVAVVTGGGDNFLAEFFGGDKAAYEAQAGSPLLFDVGQTTNSVTNMITLNNSATRSMNYNLTNPSGTNGEFVVLFYWDGKSDTVQDVDIVGWGSFTASSANAYAPKTGNYRPEAGTHVNLSVANDGDVLIRTSTVEQGEVATAGNGITGHDESTEVTAPSWFFSNKVGGVLVDATPGLTSMTLSGANVPPTINSVTRDKQYPTASESVVLTADVTDDGTIAGVNFFIDAGTGTYTSTAATAAGSAYSVTVGPYADNTVVKYYVEATDNLGATSVWPFEAAATPYIMAVDNAPATSADIVINEIHYDHIGTDTNEWIELYNRRNEPVSLAGFRLRDSTSVYFTFPDDAVIAANGFVILCFRPLVLAAEYPGIPAGTPVYQYPFSLDNTAESLYLSHPNELFWDTDPTYLDLVQYSKNAPWPVTNSNTTGRSIQLISPELDNNDPANWVGSPEIKDGDVYLNGGTPGEVNTTVSSVSDWSVY